MPFSAAAATSLRGVGTGASRDHTPSSGCRSNGSACSCWRQRRAPEAAIGAAVGARAAAAGAPAALWGVSRAAPYAASRPHPHAAPAGSGGGGRQHEDASLELGQTPHAGLCPRPGNLSGVAAGDAADHRRPHAGGGDPHEPAPSAALGRPAPERAGAFLPRPLCVGLHLRHAADRCRACGWWAAVRPLGAPAACARGPEYGRYASRSRRGGC